MKWTEVKVVGKTLTLPENGTVLSYGPAGWEPPRPPGTTGPYENTDVDASFATYRPVAGKVAVFPFRPHLPNTDGLSAIAMEDPQ